jgi:hypothetical protein
MEKIDDTHIEQFKVQNVKELDKNLQDNPQTSLSLSLRERLKMKNSRGRGGRVARIFFTGRHNSEITQTLGITEKKLKYNDFLIKTVHDIQNKLLHIEVSNDKSFVKYKSTIQSDNNILNYFNLDNYILDNNVLDENLNKKRKYDTKYIDEKSYLFNTKLPIKIKFSNSSYGILTMELIRLNINNSITEITEITEFKISLHEHNIEKELNEIIEKKNNLITNIINDIDKQNIGLKTYIDSFNSIKNNLSNDNIPFSNK